MSAELMTHICPYCQKTLANKYNLLNHIKTFHENSTGMDVERPKCQSYQCQYTARYQCEVQKHQEKCLYFLVDRETHALRDHLKSEFDQEIRRLKSHYESQLEQKEYELNHLKSEYESRLKLMHSEHEFELKQLQSDHEKDLIQVSVPLEKQICSLQTANDMLQTQLDKREQSYEQLANRAVDRPTITNQQNTQINAVKITNYLTDYKTYQQQTDASWVMQQARSFFEKYFKDWINGQKALARFVVEHIIRCSDNGRMILCCTDTSRKRFIFMNAQDEQQEDMLAKLFMEKISKPIKEVSHQIFNEIVAHLEEDRRNRITAKANAFEVGEIDDRIKMANDKLFQIYEFDVESKNGDFLNELAGQLRGPKADA